MVGRWIDTACVSMGDSAFAQRTVVGALFSGTDDGGPARNSMGFSLVDSEIVSCGGLSWRPDLHSLAAGLAIRTSDCGIFGSGLGRVQRVAPGIADRLHRILVLFLFCFFKYSIPTY